jgi:GT2 family glycosyltransferase
MLPRVAIAVLNWKGWQDTVQCLHSLQAVAYPNKEIIVVDNGSGPADLVELGTWAPHITLIENATNRGLRWGEQRCHTARPPRPADRLRPRTQ